MTPQAVEAPPVAHRASRLIEVQLAARVSIQEIGRVAGRLQLTFTWQNSQLYGGSIWLWPTRQSAICGNPLRSGRSETSSPRWHASQGFCVLSCTRNSGLGGVREVFLSIAAAISGARLPSFRCSW